MEHVDRLVSVQQPAIAAGADEGIRVMGSAWQDATAEAREALAQMRHALDPVLPGVDPVP